MGHTLYILYNQRKPGKYSSFPPFSQNLMNSFFTGPHRETCNRVKTGIVEYDIDFLSFLQKITLIILHSRQEGSTKCCLNQCGCTNFLCLFFSLQLLTDLYSDGASTTHVSMVYILTCIQRHDLPTILIHFTHSPF